MQCFIYEYIFTAIGLTYANWTNEKVIIENERHPWTCTSETGKCRNSNEKYL